MQSILTGLGSGGRIRTLSSGTPVPAGGRLLKRAAVVRKALDQTADQVVRPGVRDVAHHLRHVHHGIALTTRLV